MFFKKKKQTPTPQTRAEQRAQYRKRAAKSQALEAWLRAPKWDALAVELVDLSLRGAGIRVPFVHDRNLKIDDVVEIAIGSMMRTEIVTAARIANVARDGESHVRYGLEFLNVNKLYAQLDSFYARHFNRRRHVRVLPSLERKVQARVRFGGEELTGNVFDISEQGLGLALTRDNAARLADIESFELVVKLPGIPTELSGKVHVKHRTALQNQSLIGLVFDEDAESGFVAARGELQSFVEKRAAEMSMWEKSWG